MTVSFSQSDVYEMLRKKFKFFQKITLENTLSPLSLLLKIAAEKI